MDMKVKMETSNYAMRRDVDVVFDTYSGVTFWIRANKDEDSWEDIKFSLNENDLIDLAEFAHTRVTTLRNASREQSLRELR